MGPSEAEIWARCAPCERWFFCQAWFDKTAPAPVCPVCGTDPVAIENRACRQPSQQGPSPLEHPAPAR